jgi:deazaflavin-dependent oxidoreductase (nitroreductase family)
VDEAIRTALARDRTIDITTTGRRTGRSRRIEIWSYYVDGKVYLSGSPGRRDWYANLLANPDFVLHLKRSVRADLPARAHPILGREERRAVVSRIFEALGRDGDVDAWVERSPLVEVEFVNGDGRSQ